jgi:ParB family chromosome partitioning protein
MNEVLIDQIRPSPYQLRLTFKTEDLKQEIQRDGLLSPLIVRKKEDFYELIDGQRRFETLKELGWKKIPVEIQQVDDKKARLMVYKLNSIRESYSVEEKARYFKKLYDEGMTFYQIGKELNVDDSWILAHINVFKFPEDIQNAVWSGELSISHVQRLEPVIGANMEEATKVAKEVLFRRISVSQTEELVKDRKEAVEKARMEAAKRAIGVMTPIAEVKLETPEDLERAATALKKEAKKKREETLTAEDKVKIEAERKHKERERQEKAEELKRREETERKEREEEVQRRVDDEARHRARQIEATERRRIEEETLKKAEEKLLKDPTFLQKARAELSRIESTPSVREVEELEKIPKEMVVKEGTIYTVGEYECPHCKKHYLIKCNGREDWVE